MTSSRSVTRIFFTLLSWYSLAFAASQAAPSAPIAGLIGGWSGESSRTAGGETAGKRFADARRYWVEGDALRGEVLMGSGNSLQTVRIAIIPRLGYFLKILTAENGRTEMLVGVPAEKGVLWTPLAGDRNRFVERVTEEGGQRRFELLVPEGDPAALTWRVAETLKPSESALSGVVGGGTAVAEPIVPLRLPPEAELALIDRVAELLVQRDAARGDTANLARELAAAWRESEGANARAKALDADLAELKTKSASAVAPARTTESGAPLETAQKDATEARRWADELEKSLRGATAKAEEASARLDGVTRELAVAQENIQRLAAERDTLTAQLEARTQDAAGPAARVAQLEAEVRGLRDQAAVATAALAESAKAGPALARLAESEAALAAARSELESFRAAQVQAKQEAGRAQDEKAQLAQRVADLTTQLTAAETRRADVEASLATAQVRLGTAEAERQDLTVRLASATGADAQRTGLQQQLDEATALATKREQELAAAVGERDALRARVVEFETRIAAIQGTAANVAGTADRIAALERDSNGLREQLAATTAQHGQLELAAREAATARQQADDQLVVVTRDRDATRERLAALQTQMENWAKDAPPASDDNAAGRVAALENDLGSIRGELAATAARLTGLQEQARAALEAKARAEAELAAARAELTLAGTRSAELQQAVADALQSAEASTSLERQSEAELGSARERLAELENQLAAERSRIAQLETVAQNRPARTPPSVPTDARIADLETRLATTFARAQERQDEVDRLAARVRDLESASTPARATSTPPAAPAFSLAPLPSAPGNEEGNRRRLAESEAARRALAQRNRDEERARSSETPPVVAASTPPLGRSRPTAAPPAAEPAIETPIRFRLSPEPVRPPAPASGAPAVRLRPTRPSTEVRASVEPPASSEPGQDDRVAGAVRNLAINGYRRAGNDSVVIISGRPYRLGAIVDARLGLRFTRLEGDAIVFTGPAGAEYRFRL